MHLVVGTIIELGPIVLRGFSELNVDGADTINQHIVPAVALTLLSNNFKGSNVFQAAEALGKGLKVFHRNEKRFVDPEQSFATQGIADGSLLLLTTITDGNRLSSLIQIRKLTEIEKLALEIRRGK